MKTYLGVRFGNHKSLKSHFQCWIYNVLLLFCSIVSVLSFSLIHPWWHITFNDWINKDKK